MVTWQRGGVLCKALGARLPGGGQVCSRLSASRSFIKGFHLHAYPARGYFSVKKSNQKSLGEAPETPTRRYTPPGNAAHSRSGIRRRL